ncbi:MAG TPA: hypothetical protein VGK19_08075 [Capsulimonadaceae bacterium]|jgi:hypothetical protein
MSIIMPIMVVALILGLTKTRMTPAYWIILSLTIVLTLARYAMKH